MKEKLNTNHPDKIIEFINQTEFAGMVAYDARLKRLIPLCWDLSVYFDPIHWVLEIKKGKRMTTDKE